MKTSILKILFLIFLSSPITSFGQKITVHTLLDLINKNYDFIDTKLSSCNLTFEMSYKLDKGTAYVYSDNKIKTGFTEYAVTFQIVSDKCESIQYQVCCLSDYSSLKSQLKSMGFLFYKVDNEVNGTKQIYHNKNLNRIAELVTDMGKNSVGNKGTRYYLVLY